MGIAPFSYSFTFVFTPELNLLYLLVTAESDLELDAVLVSYPYSGPTSTYENIMLFRESEGNIECASYKLLYSLGHLNGVLLEDHLLLISLRGPGLHQNYLEIDFMVVSDRGE